MHFWQKMEALPMVSGDLSASVRDALQHLLPERGLDYRVTSRIAGLAAWGSSGGLRSRTVMGAE